MEYFHRIECYVFMLFLPKGMSVSRITTRLISFSMLSMEILQQFEVGMLQVYLKVPNYVMVPAFYYHSFNQTKILS